MLKSPYLSKEQIIMMAAWDINNIDSSRSDKSGFFQRLANYSYMNGYRSLEEDLSFIGELYSQAAKESPHEGSFSNPVMKKLKDRCYQFMSKYFVEGSDDIKLQHIQPEETTGYKDADDVPIKFGSFMVSKDRSVVLIVCKEDQAYFHYLPSHKEEKVDEFSINLHEFRLTLEEDVVSMLLGNGTM